MGRLSLLAALAFLLLSRITAIPLPAEEAGGGEESGSSSSNNDGNGDGGAPGNSGTHVVVVSNGHSVSPLAWIVPVGEF